MAHKDKRMIRKIDKMYVDSGSEVRQMKHYSTRSTNIVLNALQFINEIANHENQGIAVAKTDRGFVCRLS